MKILLIFVDKRHINAVLSDNLAQIHRHRAPEKYRILPQNYNLCTTNNKLCFRQRKYSVKFVIWRNRQKCRNIHYRIRK